MQNAHHLSPDEKRKLARFLKDTRNLLRRPQHSEFVARQRVRMIINRLGCSYADPVLIAKATDIIGDLWPRKYSRLIKLIYG